MHKMEPPSRLMKETKTFHKSLQFLTRWKDIVVITKLSSQSPAHLAQISNNVQTFQIDDYL